MKDSHPSYSRKKDLSKKRTGHGSNQPLLIWIDCKVESTVNKREHHMVSHKRSKLQREAVRRAVADLDPPSVPEESGHQS